MVSRNIEDAVREQDVVARWGGEEFLILLPETEIKYACILSEQIREIIEKQIIEYNKIELSVSMTFGVTTNDDDEMIDNTIRRADKAMYKGKNEGRNCVKINFL